MAFSSEVEKEYELFQSVKAKDFQQILSSYVDTQIEYHEKSLKAFQELIPQLENFLSN